MIIIDKNNYDIYNKKYKNLIQIILYKLLHYKIKHKNKLKLKNKLFSLMILYIYY